MLDIKATELVVSNLIETASLYLEYEEEHTNADGQPRTKEEKISLQNPKQKAKDPKAAQGLQSLEHRCTEDLAKDTISFANRR